MEQLQEQTKGNNYSQRSEISKKLYVRDRIVKSQAFRELMKQFPAYIAEQKGISCPSLQDDMTIDRKGSTSLLYINEYDRVRLGLYLLQAWPGKRLAPVVTSDCQATCDQMFADMRSFFHELKDYVRSFLQQHLFITDTPQYMREVIVDFIHKSISPDPGEFDSVDPINKFNLHKQGDTPVGVYHRKCYKRGNRTLYRIIETVEMHPLLIKIKN